MIPTHRRFLSLAAACAAAFLVSCSDDDNDFEEAADEAAEAAREIQAEAAGAWNEFADFSVDKKDDAVDFLEVQAEKLDAQIAALKAKAAIASGETKEKYRDVVDDLELRRADLGDQLDKLEDATESTWDTVKSETRRKWNDFTTYLERKADELD